MNSFAQKLLSLIALSAVLVTTVQVPSVTAFSFSDGDASEAYQDKWGMNGLGNMPPRAGAQGANPGMGNTPPSDSGSGSTDNSGMGNLTPGAGKEDMGNQAPSLADWYNNQNMGNMPPSDSGSSSASGSGMGNLTPGSNNDTGSSYGNAGNLVPGAGKEEMGNTAPNLADWYNNQNMGNMAGNQSSSSFDLRGMGNGVSNSGYGSSARADGYQYPGNQVPNQSQGFSFGSQSGSTSYGNQVPNTGYGSSARPDGYQYTGNMVSNTGSTGSSNYGNQVPNNGSQSQGFQFGSSNPYGNSYGNTVPYGYGNSLVPGGYVYTGNSNMGNLVPNGSTVSDTGNLVANNTTQSTSDMGNLVPNDTNEATELRPQSFGDDGPKYIEPDDYHTKYYRVLEKEVSSCQNRPYPRDIDGHWSEIYVRRLYDLCVVEGYTDGFFRPNALVTRAELIKMGLFANGIEPNHGCYDRDCGSPFMDLDEWQGKWVRPAYDRGIIKGYAYNELRPNQPITRAEAVKVVLATYGYQPIPTNESFFNDVSGWSTGWIERARIIGLVQGIGNGNFDPNRPITRAEAAKIVAKMIEHWDTNVARDNANLA